MVDPREPIMRIMTVPGEPLVMYPAIARYVIVVTVQSVFGTWFQIDYYNDYDVAVEVVQEHQDVVDEDHMAEGRHPHADIHLGASLTVLR